jgi:hypothetical protein
MVRDTSRSEAQIVSCVVSGVGFLGSRSDFQEFGEHPWPQHGRHDLVLDGDRSISGLGQPLHALILAVVVLSTNIVLRALA